MYKAKILDRVVTLTDEEYEKLLDRYDKRHWKLTSEIVDVPCPLCDIYIQNGCLHCPFNVFAYGSAKGCHVALKSVYPTFVQYIQTFPGWMVVREDNVLGYDRMYELACGACGRLQNRMKKLFKYVEET